MGLKLIRGSASDGGYVIGGDIHITFRELEALNLAALGLENQEAAEKMSISVNTFRNHVYSVMKKLGASNRANALLRTVENGMFEVSYSRYLLGWSPDDWVLCWNCNRAFPAEEALVIEQESFIVDHVEIEPPPELICPYEGCGARLWDGWEWAGVQELKPEFPEIPERGKVYKVTWLSKKVEDFIEKKRKETGKGK